MRTFYRPTKHYQYFYLLIKELLEKSTPPIRIIDYSDIDWMRISSHTVLLRINQTSSELTIDEISMIVSQRSAELSDKRLEELRSLFWILAKIQSDEDLIKDLTKKE